MALGYDVYDDNRDFEQSGLTGEVRRYTTSKMSFPCFVIVTTEDKPVQMYKISVLQKMFATSQDYDADNADMSVNVYFAEGEQVAHLGRILANQVKPFLRLFEENNVVGYLDKDTPLVDDYRYVLSQ